MTKPYTFKHQTTLDDGRVIDLLVKWTPTRWAGVGSVTTFEIFHEDSLLPDDVVQLGDGEDATYNTIDGIAHSTLKEALDHAVKAQLEEITQ